MTEDTEACPLPEGDYAIVEMMGWRKIVGRVAEVERFGSKMLQVEPIFGDGFLSPILTTSASLYQFTTCTRETAWRCRAKDSYSLPDTVRATLAPAQLPPPVTRENTADLPFGYMRREEDEGPEFAEVDEEPEDNPTFSRDEVEVAVGDAIAAAPPPVVESRLHEADLPRENKNPCPRCGAVNNTICHGVFAVDGEQCPLDLP